METPSLANQTIVAILTPLCSPVHEAWVGELTTPIATARAVLELEQGGLVLIEPCEVTLEAGKYPSLELEVTKVEKSCLVWQAPDGQSFTMSPLDQALTLLPFTIASVERSDPLQEGATSELELLNAQGARLLFRHIMPPMTLGIDVVPAGRNA